VVIPHASHAAVAEQPAFIADELIKYARGLPAAAPPDWPRSSAPARRSD
jgi:hypothetical protein